ncbi:DMT family transporter [Lentibacillus sp. Marseille-P4043]|uniref:DMT family transporter n=1 Tax=Lentibacillus sp. Marseille-P4043 TaxID=2040293 RepID=UPI002279371D|nr:DMT family transporter [Lentibacillus sp. Marseille-P4043]
MGDLYIFLAVLSQALSFIYIKRASATMKSSLITGSMLLIGSFLLFVVSIVMEPAGLSSLKNGTIVGWTVFLASGILATGIGHFLYNGAIQHIGAGRTSIFLNMSPFFALLGSVLFLGEVISIVQILAFVLIVVSVILGSGLGDRYVYRRRRDLKENA